MCGYKQILSESILSVQRHVQSLLVAALFMSVMCSCSDQVTVDQKIVDAYVELRLAEIVYEPTSPTVRIARHDILKKYGYTLEGYQKKVQSILDDEAMWVPFQKAVVARIDTLLLVPASKDSVPGKPNTADKPPLKSGKSDQFPKRKGGVK
ncbi:MAG: hypothetical protein HUK20_09025 [Fibrobacter sp.]|nr:hypothetical protein [Fibrobacter sp.]